ncbi:hypothetical protein TRIP_C60028 [Candidatus Zixiibacteriota bacterium]|nr:hypothetical protein TRIP_C60028 [candidate division Zixibacteria bacterium]
MGMPIKGLWFNNKQLEHFAIASSHPNGTYGMRLGILGVLLELFITDTIFEVTRKYNAYTS